MKNTKTQRSWLPKLLIVMVMIATLVCSFTIMSSAADSVTEIHVGLDDLTVNLDKDAEGKYTKEYDGTDAVTVTVNATKAELGIDAAHDVTVVASAKFLQKDASADTYILIDLSLTGADADKYALDEHSQKLSVGATITPKKLTWAGKANASVVYHPGSLTYDVALNQFPALNGVLAGEDAGLPAALNLSVQAPGATTAPIAVSRDVALTNPNYVVAPLSVEVSVNKLVITEVKWDEKYEFNFGDPAAKQITVVGKDADGKEYLLKVEYKKSADGKEYASAPGEYSIAVSTADDNIVFQTAPDPKKVTIKVLEFIVGMNDTVFAGNANIAQVPSFYMIAVKGINGSVVPAEVLAKITYTVDGKPFTGAYESKSYQVVAKLPEGYVFKDASGKEITSLTATMTINLTAVSAGDSEKPYQVFLTGPAGVTNTISAVVTTPKIAPKALKGFARYSAYNVVVSGSGDGAYSIILGIDDKLVDTRCGVLTADDLYIYDTVTKDLIKASAKYIVSDPFNTNGYYEIAGVTGDENLIFVIAPEYEPHFHLTALGITLVILFILFIIIILTLIGLAKRKNDKKAEEVVEEPVEEAVEAIAPVEEETTACEELAEEVTEEIAEEIPAEEIPAEETDATEEAAEALEELVEEAAEEELPVAEEEPAEEAEAEADADILAAAVANAMEAAEEAVAEEEAVEVVAAVETEDEDDDDDKDDDDDDENMSFGGFGMAGLKFIDINAEPEAYAEMLRQEQAGEIQIVYRYRRSYMSRMIQSQGSVQEYYNVIKNALLSYKGVKGRVSWNYEAFNRGRVHVAKINAKTKTLYLYLALDPEELADTKYGIVDVSSKKKYASVPVLMKIKGDRKFKYALELIEKLCAEQFQLPAVANYEEVDYTAPYQSTEELVEAGFVKALAAAVPLNPVSEEAPAEETVEEAPVEETAPAAEAENVTFVEPTDAPAVAAAAEEIAEEPTQEA